MPHNSSHEARARARESRYAAYLSILAVTGPITYRELTRRMGALVSCYDRVTRDISQLLENEEVLTLRKPNELTLVCCADYELEAFDGFAKYDASEIKGKRRSKSVMPPAARLSSTGIVVTELGPGHRKISFEHGWKSAGGQRFVSHARCVSSAENIYA